MLQNGQKNESIIVGIADLKIGKAPSTISTLLGSCVGVCLYSADKKVGGVLHIMMAKSGDAIKNPNFKKAKYADTGIPELLKQLKNVYGVDSDSIVAKIFGGAKILKEVTVDIGMDNEIEVKRILKDSGIKIVAANTGGDKGYKIELILETGKVNCQVFGQSLKEF